MIERVNFTIPLGIKRKPYTGRFYTDGVHVGCGVTTAKSCLVPIHLQDWMRRNAEEDLDKKSEETSAIGNLGHALLQAEANGQPMKPGSEEMKSWYEEWQHTQRQYKISAEATEFPVLSAKYLYGGTVDRYGMFDGKKCIIDYKTGSYSHIHLWTTEAYRQAFMEMTGEKDLGAVVLYLPRPDLVRRGHKVRHYTIEHHDSCFLAFLAAYYDFRMLYFKELTDPVKINCKVAMDPKRIFEPLTDMYYEQRFGEGIYKRVPQPEEMGAKSA